YAEFSDRLGGRLDGGFGTGTEGDVGAFGGEGLNDRPTDASGAAGDDRPLALQLEIHPSLPLWTLVQRVRSLARSGSLGCGWKAEKVLCPLGHNAGEEEADGDP